MSSNTISAKGGWALYFGMIAVSCAVLAFGYFTVLPPAAATGNDHAALSAPKM